MPGYELCCLASTKVAQRELVALVKRVGAHIMERGGVVRRMEKLGTFALGHRARKHQMTHNTAHYFVFDVHAGPETMNELRQQLAYDERVIRLFLKRSG